MDTTHTIQSYDYVNHPYDQVRAALLANPQHVFRRATSAESVDDAVLRVNLSGVEVGVEIVIDVVRVDQIEVPAPATALTLRWRAARNPTAFPAMFGTLRVYPLTPTETQLAFEGSYTPPLGVLGNALDAFAGNGLAKESVARFVAAVAAWLREELVAVPPTPTATATAAKHSIDAEC